MRHDCKYDSLISEIITDIREIRSDVKSLLSFKFNLLGTIAGISFVVSVIFTVVVAIFS